MLMRYVTALVVLGTALFVAPAAHAQNAFITVTYSAGWNMVGGPAATTFSGATGLDIYSNGAYSPAPAIVTNPCAGMWAYFPGPTAVALATSTVPSVTCPLAGGWNLIGNPFSGSALVPAGTIAYYWNADAARYDLVTSIPAGGSAWIYSTGVATITLQFFSVAQPPVPALITDSFPTNPGPYTVHVGDALRLLIPLTNPYDVVANPRFLILEGAGETGDMTCLGTCVINLLDQFYTFRAIASGATTLTLTPRCLQSSPPCGEPTATVTVNILP